MYLSIQGDVNSHPVPVYKLPHLSRNRIDNISLSVGLNSENADGTDILIAIFLFTCKKPGTSQMQMPRPILQGGGAHSSEAVQRGEDQIQHRPGMI